MFQNHAEAVSFVCPCHERILYLNTKSFVRDDVIRIAAEEEKNRMESFYNILSDYYGDDLINKIKREMSEDTSAGFPEAGKVLLNCVIEMCEDSSVTVENKMILKDVAQSIVKLNNVNDEELENKINDL